MTPQEAIHFIEHHGWSSTRLGLSRTRELLGKMGDPQKALRFIHVAGSNGKGSTCAMLTAILRAAGYHVGLYISPYIQDFCERIQLDGQNIPGEDLARITERVQEIAENMADHPSQFEMITAIGMQYFKEQHADIVVLEVGMGGAMDSTNVIDAPEAAVIMNIGLEHTEFLGNTLEEIAETKAGIIKAGTTAICYDGAPEVTAVVRRVCKERAVPLRFAAYTEIEPIASDLGGQRFRRHGQEYHLALLGAHQLHNVGCVLETVEALRERGWEIPEEAVQTGLATVQWPVRLEVMHREHPLVILDGGHNPQCAEALAASLRALLPGRKITFIIGVLADKDYAGIMEQVIPLAQEFICLTPVSDRAMPAADLAAYLASQGAVAIPCDTVEDGIAAAITAAGDDGVIVGFGSLYLAGVLRTTLQQVNFGSIRQ